MTSSEKKAYRHRYYLAKEQGTEKFRARCRKHRRLHYERHREEVLADSRCRAEETKALVVSYKDRPCEDCGMSYPPYVMDLDHVRGTKIAHLGSGRFKQSLRLTIEEVLKCDVVCANCHREREHRKRLQQ
jgi:hypothetical protein